MSLGCGADVCQFLRPHTDRGVVKTATSDSSSLVLGLSMDCQMLLGLSLLYPAKCPRHAPIQACTSKVLTVRQSCDRSYPEAKVTAEPPGL